MERQKFNDEWKKAFEQAEISPNENVWVNIELDLEKAKGSRLKKRLVFYQLLAAASVIFSIGAGVSVYVLRDNTSVAPALLANQSVPAAEKKMTTPSSDIENSTENNRNEATVTIPKAENDQLQSTNANDEFPTDNDVTKAVNGSANKHAATIDFTGKDQTNTSILPTALEKNSEDKHISLAETNVELPVLLRRVKIEGRITSPQKEETVVDPVVLMMARLEQREREVQKEETEEKKEMSEKLWTSVGFAAGSFSAVNAGVSSPSPTSTFAQNKPMANQEAKASGVTYSVGVNMGTKLSERWVIQGGFSYMTQSSDYTANTAVAALQPDNSTKFRPQSINELERLDEMSVSTDQIFATPPYNVNNNLKYLSIPLQAGYLIVDRTFGLQLNAGVSTDLFLQNIVTPEGENLDKTTQGPGGNSPYRTVNLSGLMSTEVSYRFGTHYRIALNPGIRYPFNSIYRSELDVKSTPLSFDVGVRFRYIFH